MKISPKIQCCLVILISLLRKAQQVAASDNLTCNDRQYMHGTLRKCCSRCPPGTCAKKLCTETSDTQCQPCEEGKYSATWNYAYTCMNCKPCESSLVEKEKCSSTKKEQCVCPEGHECMQLNGVGVCMVCRATISPTTVLPPFEPTAVPVTSAYPWVITLVIVAVVITVAVTFIMLCVKCKTLILEKLGCMSKVKKPLPESSGLEVIVPPTSESLLPNNGLRYPIEETNATQSAEYALNSMHRPPI
ncbi:tumor necrosis factor receptor superfamily member 3 [Mantella aurantiaca]